MKIGISIIICCYNSAERLKTTLKHIAHQLVPNGLNWEILVVDNASTDNTIEVASHIWKDLSCKVSFKIFQQPKSGLTYAREKGIEEARFSYILFCDDDNWLSENYLSIGYKTLMHYKNVGVLGGLGKVISDVPIPEWFHNYSGYYATFPLAKKSGYLTNMNAAIPGAGMFIKKEVFEILKQNGFISLLTDRKGTTLSSGGDYELCYAIRLLGYKLYYEEKLTFLHYMPAQRLTKDYLINLVTSIAYSNTQLIPYMHVLSGSKISYINWFKDFLYKVKYVFQAYLNYYFNLNGSQLDLEIGRKSSIQQLKSIWEMKVGYIRKYKRILKLFR